MLRDLFFPEKMDTKKKKEEACLIVPPDYHVGLHKNFWTKLTIILHLAFDPSLS